MRGRTWTSTWGAALGAAWLAGAAWAGTPDDDLAVVKKAMTAGPAASSPSTAAITPAPPPSRGEKAQWLRVRIVEKGAKKAKASLKVPLSLARALGDDIDWRGQGKNGERRVTLSEALSALESGQALVEIDDEDTTVRIWVE